LKKSNEKLNDENNSINETIEKNQSILVEYKNSVSENNKSISELENKIN
jgi:hypothetical protein